MLPALFQARFVVFLAVACHAQALVRSNHNSMLSSRGFGNETQCSWNCTVIESDLTDETKFTIARGKLIQLVVKYEHKVDDKCVNQTSRNSSGNATEHWQIWLTNRQRSTLAKVMESLENWMFDNDLNKERKEIRALCTLNPTGTTAAIPEHNRGIHFPAFSRGHLAALGLRLDTTDCNLEETENLQPCINITNPADKSKTSKSPFDVFGRDGLSFAAVYAFCFVAAAFIHYTPAFLCLLSPTVVTKDGVHEIILEGASPVSLRSVMGNYFFSENDGTIKHKARTFILRVVIIPLPFIGLTIFTSLKVFNYSQTQQFLLVCCVFYFIHAFYISFFTARVARANPCSVCRFVKPKTIHCQDELPRLIRSHLRLQPLILVQCWRLFVRYILSYYKMTLIKFPSCYVAIACLLRVFIFVFFLSTIPVVALALFIGILFKAFFYVLLSSPILMLSKTRNAAINVPICKVFRCCVTVLGTFGAICVILASGVGFLWILLLGFDLLFSDESLPYVTCIFLVLYYVWSSYSTFTNNYQDLALALFKHYKIRQENSGADGNGFVAMAVNTDQVQVNITAECEDNAYVMKIPKGLFDMACEELMPIREGVCIMILKITIIASFVFLVFTMAMLRGGGATPFMKALLTFLTGLFPKILAIYIDGGRQKKIEAMATDENIPKIVQEYIITKTEASGSNQISRENSGADGDEVSLVNENGENVSLINI